MEMKQTKENIITLNKLYERCKNTIRFRCFECNNIVYVWLEIGEVPFCNNCYPKFYKKSEEKRKEILKQIKISIEKPNQQILE